jgi:dipeptidyl-peptidase-3
LFNDADNKKVNKKSGDMYSAAIDQIISWLEKAKGVAENDKQANALG